MQCDCIVLDEPIARPVGRKEVMDTLHQLNREGITVIIITHFMEEAVQAERVVVIEAKSRWTSRGTSFKVKELKDMGLMPVAAELADRLRQGLTLPHRLSRKRNWETHYVN